MNAFPVDSEQRERKTYSPHLLCLDYNAVQHHQIVYIGDIVLSLRLFINGHDRYDERVPPSNLDQRRRRKEREREHLHIFPC